MSLALQLIAAIRLKDNGKVSELLERMDVSDVNRKGNGDTALHVACRGPNEVLDLLLSKTGIDVNVKNGSSFTPLHIACRLNNHYAVQKILISAQVDVNAKTLSGRTPLHLACINNYHQIVFHLLASPGIQVNVKDGFYLLASPGIQVNVKDILGKTPIMDSAGHCHKEGLKLMLEDPRVDLGEGERRLEVQVRRFGGTEKEKCLEMINNERKKRENGQVKQEQPSQAGNIGIGIEKVVKLNKEMGDGEKIWQENSKDIGIGIEKVDKLNKEIGDGEKRWQENLKDRKQKRQDLKERQTLEMKSLTKQNREEEMMLVTKHKEEEAMLNKKYKEKETIMVKKHKEEVATLENKFVSEDQAEKRYTAVLREYRDELAKDLEKIINDPEGYSSSEDHNKIEAAKRSLECPICMELMRPPTRIWMCRFTHIICQLCKDLLKEGKCPTCTNERLTQRAFIVENLARTIFNE